MKDKKKKKKELKAAAEKAEAEETKTEAEIQAEILSEILSETKNQLIDKIIKSYELKSHEIAEVVELFYDCQKLRIMHGNKKRSEPPSMMVAWLDHWLKFGEKVIHSKLEKWIESDDSPAESKWAFEQRGIGPVLAAGLAAHINVTKANYISSVWKFAGLAPGADRKVKGVKLPYNARLKTLCWKLGESFVKVSGKDGATYGQLYSQFKSDEVSRNENGLYHKQANKELSSKKIKDTATKIKLESGKLTDGHLHARAKRRAVKIFLAEYWTVGRKSRNLPIHEPYAIAILHHSGKIDNVGQIAATSKK